MRDPVHFNDYERNLNMGDKMKSNDLNQDVEFHTALGWLAALSVSIAAWAGLAS